MRRSADQIHAYTHAHTHTHAAFHIYSYTYTDIYELNALVKARDGNGAERHCDAVLTKYMHTHTRTHTNTCSIPHLQYVHMVPSGRLPIAKLNCATVRTYGPNWKRCARGAGDAGAPGKRGRR